MYNRSLYLAALAAACIGFGAVTGCSSGESSSAKGLYNAAVEATNESGENISVFDYKIILNDEEITFPVSLSELKGSGWTAEDDSRASGYYEKNGVRILLRMCDKNGDDFTVNGVSVTNRKNSEVQYTLKNSQGVEMNVSTKEDVEKIYGSADKVWDNGEYFYYQFGADMAVDKDTDRNNIGFGFDDVGIVRSIWITH